MPLLQQQQQQDDDDAVAPLPPALSVIVPVYEASGYIHSLMDTLLNQTYPNLELIFSFEPTDDADETEAAIWDRYNEAHANGKAGSPIVERSVRVYRQPNRLFYAANMNYLLSQVETDYFSYMQVDDVLPSEYYEELAKCLDANPGAINCYPRIVTRIPDDDFFRTMSNATNATSFATMATKQQQQEQGQDSAVGPRHVRVEQVVMGNYYYPNRGLVRMRQHRQNNNKKDNRYKAFTYPRLYQAFTSSDVVAMVKQAIMGDMVAVDVPYYKRMRIDSIANSHHRNQTVFSNDDYVSGHVDGYVQRFNVAHSYVSNSRELAQRMSDQIGKKVSWYLQHFRNVDDRSAVVRIGQEAVNDFSTRIRKVKRVAILGAGIQGSLMALMFRKHGYDVTVIDKSSEVMARTSTTGEGRIHMGLEYANDASMGTAKFMLESSMRFSSYVEYLVGKEIDWPRLTSERLTCLLPHTSHVTPSQFEEYGERLGKLYEGILSDHPELSYLGNRPPKVLLGRTDVPESVNASYVNAAYESIEVCILSNKLKEVVEDALLEHGVTMVFNRTILDVKRNDDEIAKSKNTPGAVATSPLGRLKVVSDIGEHDYDAVVNCLWEGRAEIDRKMGLANGDENESYRVKANVRLPNLPKFHANIPSVSVMNGPFGDFVRYGPDDAVYFAWHPMSPTVITHNVSDVRRQFEGHAQSEFPPGYEKDMITGHREAFEMLFPGYDTGFFDDAVVGTGYVVANGLTDIDDPQSGLHERDDPPNLVKNGYVSVKTQKLTNAPYNAYLLEQQLFLKNDL